MSDKTPDRLELTAYRVSAEPLALRPAERRRLWMDETPQRYAYRCLPLVIANQIGWEVLCPVDFSAVWDGGSGKEAIRCEFSDAPSSYVQSHFGSGVLTFSLGYLFRTAPGHNLWCKGPANEPKDAIAPLEGIIETDWAPYTFTMNWKFTRKDQPVRFSRGEPVAALLPLPRAYLQQFDPVQRPIHGNPELQKDFSAWSQSRAQFIGDLKVSNSAARQQGWQRSYMLGKDMRQAEFQDHETKLQLPGFREQD